MKFLTLALLLQLNCLFVNAQIKAESDSLLHLLTITQDDTRRIHLLSKLSYYFFYSKPDSAMQLAQDGLKLATLINYPKGIAYCNAAIGQISWIIGDYLKANELLLQTMQFGESTKDTALELDMYSALSSSFRDQGNYREALNYSFQGSKLDNVIEPCLYCGFFNTITGSIYVQMNKADSAVLYLLADAGYGYNSLQLGHAYAQKGNDVLALHYYNKAIPLLSEINDFKDIADTYIGMARLYDRENNLDSSIYMASKGFENAQNASFKKGVFETSVFLSKIFESRDASQALKYFKIAAAAKDSMFNVQKTTRFLYTQFNEQMRQQQEKTISLNYRNKVRLYALIIILGFLLLIAGVLYRNNRRKQRAKIEIEVAYSKLKSTQSQLIQQEKMASLGQLTAGIAHEIQNPLNFVNNFSEVNTELIEEAGHEMKKGNIVEAELILEHIKENEAKINQHGKRADAIVKGMLEHSRHGTGQKQLTDINALASEYLRLAYHGMKGKDSSFNATLKTEFDESIGMINIVSQDMGRVLLNLYNNTFYAVNEKQKQSKDGYEPTIGVATSSHNGKVEIRVSDNGTGIPQKIIDKIFQPFFTTKPTGQGTGLGLSLAYDIVKAHGGEIKVETREGEGTEFIVQLPLTDKI